jgi:hypothetical protein
MTERGGVQATPYAGGGSPRRRPGQRDGDRSRRPHPPGGRPRRGPLCGGSRRVGCAHGGRVPAESAGGRPGPAEPGGLFGGQRGGAAANPLRERRPAAVLRVRSRPRRAAQGPLARPARAGRCADDSRCLRDHGSVSGPDGETEAAFTYGNYSGVADYAERVAAWARGTSPWT